MALPLPFHLGGVELGLTGVSTGSPLYDVPGDHAGALLALLALPVGAFVLRWLAGRSVRAAKRSSVTALCFFSSAR